jgi:hypothetical protein
MDCHVDLCEIFDRDAALTDGDPDAFCGVDYT